jgi:Ala-tRNA(Pro) deacylase
MAIPVPIRDFLHDRHVDFRVVTHPTAYTAQEEAAITHVPGREWAKTVVCFADNEPILAVLPAHYTVDFERLRVAAGASRIRLATETEMVGLYPGCEAGAMPPLGPLYGQRVFVDASLAKDLEVVFNAGTHVDAVRMRYDAFVTLAGAAVAAFANAAGGRAAPSATQH